MSRMASPPERKKRLQCVECGAQTVIAHRWRAYRTDVDLEDPPAVAFYCPDCAAAEFGKPLRRNESS